MRIKHSKLQKSNNTINNHSATYLINNNQLTPSLPLTMDHLFTTLTTMDTTIINKVTATVDDFASKLEDVDTETTEINVVFTIMDINKTNAHSIAGPMAAVGTTVPTAKHPVKVTSVMHHTITAWAVTTAIAAIDGVGA